MSLGELHIETNEHTGQARNFYLDGIRLPHVVGYTVRDSVTQLPEVTVTFRAKPTIQATLIASNPDYETQALTVERTGKATLRVLDEQATWETPADELRNYVPVDNTTAHTEDGPRNNPRPTQRRCIRMVGLASLPRWPRTHGDLRTRTTRRTITESWSPRLS